MPAPSETRSSDRNASELSNRRSATPIRGPRCRRWTRLGPAPACTASWTSAPPAGGGASRWGRGGPPSRTRKPGVIGRSRGWGGGPRQAPGSTQRSASRRTAANPEYRSWPLNPSWTSRFSRTRSRPDRTRVWALVCRNTRARDASSCARRSCLDGRRDLDRELGAELVRGDQDGHAQSAQASEPLGPFFDGTPIAHERRQLGEVGRQPEAVPLVLERVHAQRQEQVVPRERRHAGPGHVDGARTAPQVPERRRVREPERHQRSVDVDRGPRRADRPLERVLAVDPQGAGLLAVAPGARREAEVEQGCAGPGRSPGGARAGRCPRTADARSPRRPRPATDL